MILSPYSIFAWVARGAFFTECGVHFSFFDARRWAAALTKILLFGSIAHHTGMRIRNVFLGVIGCRGFNLHNKCSLRGIPFFAIPRGEFCSGHSGYDYCRCRNFQLPAALFFRRWGSGACMRSIFAIWSNTSREDYGLRRPRLAPTGRLCVTLLAVAGIGVGNVYSEFHASSKSDSVVDRVASIVRAGRTSVPTTEPLTKSQTVGLAPIGVADRFTIPDRPTTAESWPVASLAADSPTPRDAQAAPPTGEGTPIVRSPKVDKKSLGTERTPARNNPAFQVYDLPDRFASVPPPDRRARIARPGPSEAPL
jgi:hypothetical protein